MSRAGSDDLAFSKAPSTEKSFTSESHANDDSDDFRTSSNGTLEGWRFWWILVGVNVGQFLTSLEMTVVTTALVAVTNDLKDFNHSTWISNAYFLTWCGFLVLWSQFSRTVGRKVSILLAFGLFVIFSAACAAAQTAVQLYIFRGLQGMAGVGVFSLTIIITGEAVSPAEFPKYAAAMGLTAVFAFAAGPLIGGAIVAKTTWRWIFILNVPASSAIFMIFALALPGPFPHHRKPESERPRFKLSSLKQLDLFGGFLFLGLAILGVTALQEADSSFDWRSATVICLLTLSGLSGIAFAFWERYITKCRPNIMPLMTWRFVHRRAMANFVCAFLIGMPFIITMVQIPQRLQVVNGLSPLAAAIGLLPFSVLFTTGSFSGSMFSSRFHTKRIYGSFAGALLQLAAVICFTVDPLPASRESHIPARQYGFQILMGLGSGFSYMCNFNGVHYVINNEKELIAPALGVNLQFRYLGAAGGLGAVTAAFNTYVRQHLSSILPPDQITPVLQSSRLVASLSPDLQARVLQIFSNGFVLQWQILCGFVGLQIIALFFTI